MKALRVVLSFLLAVSQLNMLLPTSSVFATSPTGIVISHVITGESSSSSSEFVALYNNSVNDIDVTGYCIKNKSLVTVTCVTADVNTKVYVKSHNYLTFASSIFASTHTYAPDTSYVSSNSIQVGGDSLTLIDGQANELDKVTWGTSGGAISTSTNGTLQRKSDLVNIGQLVDTDTMAGDFTSLLTLVFPANASYDVVTIVDVCPNINSTQQTMPVGYLGDENGNCQPDSCLNISGLQINVPDHFDSDVAGNCVQHDECDNVQGIQATIPDYMIRDGQNDCIVHYALLELTEILPNAVGSDIGNEFIEIHNPTNDTINLGLYGVQIGLNGEKFYSFPIGATIAPGEYRRFSDSEMKFTLVNTVSRVMLTAVGGPIFGDTGAYDSPAEGESWAFISSGWQYTNQPTPAAENRQSIIEEVPVDTSDAGLACPTGKYRNPLTNRCRTIATDASILTACEADQYRNPETGRCRKISTAEVTLCKDGQYRSEETNRCRNISLASTGKPCKDNQYRSEETNRCRNLSASTVPDAAFAVQQIKDTGMAFVGWWALGGVGLVAAGYAAWEWRRELANVWRNAFHRFR